MSPAKRIMQMRHEKHAAGHPFMINSSLLGTNECVYEYPDGSMKRCKLYEGGMLITDDLTEDIKQDALKGLELAKKLAKPDCYNCVHRKTVPGSAHSGCSNLGARVSGDPHGIKSGWFLWPFNFDPVWLTDCSGYLPKELYNELKQQLEEQKNEQNPIDGVV